MSEQFLTNFFLLPTDRSQEERVKNLPTLQSMP